MENNQIVKVELNLPQAFVQDLKNYTTSFPYYDNIEKFFVEAARVAVQKLKEQSQEVAVKEAIALTLETVWEHVNSKKEPSELKTAIAGDLLKAEVDMEIAKNGKIEPEDVKNRAKELFT